MNLFTITIILKLIYKVFQKQGKIFKRKIHFKMNTYEVMSYILNFETLVFKEF